MSTPQAPPPPPSAPQSPPPPPSTPSPSSDSWPAPGAVAPQQFDQSTATAGAFTPPALADKNGLAVAALVLGIVSLPAGIVPLFWWIALPCGLLGFIFGRVARRKAKKGADREGMAKAGWITGGIGTVLGVIGMVIFFTALNDFGNDLDKIGNDLEACDSYSGQAYLDCLSRD